MKKLFILMLILAVAPSALARNANTETINNAKAQWDNLTPEQQMQLKAQAEEIYKNMTPAERAQLENSTGGLGRKQLKTMKTFR